MGLQIQKIDFVKSDVPTKANKLPTHLLQNFISSKIST